MTFLLPCLTIHNSKMTKRGKISIVVLLGISVIVACLFLPYGVSRQEEGVADYYLFPGQQIPHDYDPAIFVNAYELISSQKRK